MKEGKGGLRDLQTLFWLGRFLYRIERPEELVAHGVLDPWALRRFTKAGSSCGPYAATCTI